MTTKISFKQFQNICLPPDILSRAPDKRFLMLYMRKVSIRISWGIFRFEWLTPNMVTVFMIILGPIACALLLIQGIWGIIAFILANQLWGIVDRVDGEIARYKKIYSPAGVFLDNIAHSIINLSLFIVFGWKFYLLTNNILYMNIGLYIAIIMALGGAAYHSGKYHALDKKIPLSDNIHRSTSFLGFLFRELKAAIVDHVEISLIGGFVILAYVYLFPNPLIPQIFLFGYLALEIFGTLSVMIMKYLTLAKTPTKSS